MLYYTIGFSLKLVFLILLKKHHNMFSELFNPSSYNSQLLVQSIPGLLISLAGLILTGSTLNSANHDESLKDIPILLEANCILTFKGNVELIFAMYLSSMSQSPFFLYARYFRYVFDNSNLVLAQSATIGFIIGLIGIVKNLASGTSDMEVNLAILASSLISCTLTSVAFIILLVASIELSKYVNINPDNIILPAISSLGDYMSVKTLIHLTKQFKNLTVIASLTYILLMVSILSLCLCFAFMGKKRIPLQSPEVLLVTYTISTLGGYVLEMFRTRFPILASSFPVFGGVSVAIAFIYLHKIFTSINNRTAHNTRESYITLISTSVLMSTIYLSISMFIGLGYSYLFCVFFTVFFVVQVIVLLKTVGSLIVYLDKGEGDTGVLTLPLITCISDILAIMSLLLIAFTLEFSNKRI